MRLVVILFIVSCFFFEACKCGKDQPPAFPVNSFDKSFFNDSTNTMWVFQRNVDGRSDTLKLGVIQSGPSVEGSKTTECYPSYFATITRLLNYYPSDTSYYYIRPLQVSGGTEIPTLSVIVAQNVFFKIEQPEVFQTMTIGGQTYDSVYTLQPNFPISTVQDRYPDSVYYQRKTGLLRYVFRAGDLSFYQWNRVISP